MGPAESNERGVDGVLSRPGRDRGLGRLEK
jgi:hypothetical protein